MSKTEAQDPSVSTAEQSQTTDDQSVPLTRSCSALVIDRINDIIDFEVDHILYEKTTRLDHFGSLSYFWSFHPAKNIEAGRRFIRVFLARLLVEFCGQPAYADNNEDDETNNEDDEHDAEEAKLSEEFPRVYTFDRQRWHTLEEDLKKLRSLMQRKDANKCYFGEEGDSEQVHDIANSDMEPERKNLAVFGKKIKDMIRVIQIHGALAPIRKTLEDLITSKIPDSPDAVSQEQICEILEFADAMEDTHCRECVKMLFEQEPDSTSTTNPGEDQKYSLTKNMPLASLLRCNRYNLEYFQVRFEHLLQEMNTLVFSNFLSVLIQRRYTIETGGIMDKVIKASITSRRSIAAKLSVEDLRRSRIALKNEHGDDPLVESLRLSEHHVHASTPTGRKKRPDAPGGNENEENQPKRGRKRSDRNAAATTYPPEPGLFDDQGKVTRRTPWTEEEKTCVRQGVQQYGLGNWLAIKEEYSDILRNRTNVQIKDCWRTLVKNGIVTEAEQEAAAELQQNSPRRPGRRSSKTPPSAVANEGEEDS